MATNTNQHNTNLMNRSRLVDYARNIGCRGNLSKMTKGELVDAIERRRNILRKPAADLPATTARIEGQS